MGMYCMFSSHVEQCFKYPKASLSKTRFCRKTNVDVPEYFSVTMVLEMVSSK